MAERNSQIAERRIHYATSFIKDYLKIGSGGVWEREREKKSQKVPSHRYGETMMTVV